MNNTTAGATADQAKELIALCRAGKLYDIEKWICRQVAGHLCRNQAQAANHAASNRGRDRLPQPG